MQTSSIFSILEKSLRIVDKNAWSGLGVICPLGSLDRLVRDDRLDVREH